MEPTARKRDRMKVLSYGAIFDADFSCLEYYSGRHEVRTLGLRDQTAYPPPHNHDYWFDLADDPFPAIMDRVRRDWQPDLFLCWAPDKAVAPLAVEDSPIPTVAMASDWGYHFAALEYNLGRFDAVLCDVPGTTWLKNDLVAPHAVVPLYAHRSASHRPHDVPRDIDVLYLGALEAGMRPVRSRYLDRLARLNGRCNVVLGRGFTGDNYPRQLSRAKIVFNYNVRGELNLRVWETLACEALLMVEEHNPEVRRYFEDGRDLVLYNEHNFEARIMWYLAHPEQARAVAERGRRRALDMAAENRLDTVVDWAASQPSSGRRFRDLEERERHYQTILFVGHKEAPSARRLEAQLLERYREDYPDDPRGWALRGAIMASPYAPEDEQLAWADACLDALRHAADLAPDAAPHALNVATICRRQDRREEEAAWLERAQRATSLDGQRLLIGHFGDEFWVRWLMALPEQRTSREMLAAETHVRLAELQERRGLADDVEEHLRTALDLDPGNTRGLALLARAQWAADRRQEALDTMRVNLGRRPMDFAYRIQLAQMLKGAGHQDEADELVAEIERMASACVTGQ